MDGRGRATDNVFIERLWRSVKYEDIYLKDYTNGDLLLDKLLRDTWESLIPKMRAHLAESTPKPLQLTLQPFGCNFRWFLLSLVIFTLGNSSDAFLLVRAGELGVRREFLPFLWCVFHIAKSSSNWLLGFAVDRYGPRRFIFAGWFLYAAVYLAFGLATQPWHAWGLFLGYALFYGLTEPAGKTLVAQLVPADRKGLAFGWFNFTIGIGTLPASLIFGAIYQYAGPLAAYGWGAALAAVAMVLMGFVRDHEAKS
jgi:predicted MFS family arabinose efflux permease